MTVTSRRFLPTRKPSTGLIATARRHIESATTSAGSDPEGALALAYDAARKTATALLGHQGLRPTSAGGHIALVEAINAQFPGVEGLKSIDRLRRRRNQAEYPDPRDYDPVTKDEVDDAIAAASACVNAAEKLLDVPQLGLFR
jgi:HEPN domain-containing protein